jgi:threonine synthase
MDHVKHLKCLICGKEYAPDEVDYVCPDHGNEGILDVRYDYGLIGQRISRESLAANPDTTVWRYKPLLPMRPDAAVPPLTIGGTPLYKADRLAAELGLKHVWVKDDGRLPTASFKDRASVLAVVKAQEKAQSPIAIVNRQSIANRHHHRQHRQRRRRPQRHLRQRQAAQRHLRAGESAPGQNRPTAGLWFDGDAGEGYLRRRL